MSPLISRPEPSQNNPVVIQLAKWETAQTSHHQKYLSRCSRKNRRRWRNRSQSSRFIPNRCGDTPTNRATSNHRAGSVSSRVTVEETRSANAPGRCLEKNFRSRLPSSQRCRCPKSDRSSRHFTQLATLTGQRERRKRNRQDSRQHRFCRCDECELLELVLSRTSRFILHKLNWQNLVGKLGMFSII